MSATIIEQGAFIQGTTVSAQEIPIGTFFRGHMGYPHHGTHFLRHYSGITSLDKPSNNWLFLELGSDARDYPLVFNYVPCDAAIIFAQSDPSTKEQIMNSAVGDEK